MRSRLLPLVLLVALLVVISTGLGLAQSTTPESVVIYIFWGDGCPYCRAERAFLTELQARYPQIIVRDYEVYYNETNRAYMQQMLAAYGLEPSGVPTTFINDRYWVGFSDTIAQQIEAEAASCLQTACTDSGAGIIPIDDQPMPATVTDTMDTVVSPTTADTAITSIDNQTLPVTVTDSAQSTGENSLTLPLLGTINLDSLSLWLSTALIAFVDGFNPCSLWVLSLLLALVIHSGSRRKIAIVGLTFLTVTSAVYILFILGLFSVLSFVSFIGWIQIVVALMALVFAVINIKDYFWYKQGVSLTISDKHKPKIYRDMRGLMVKDKSTLALIGATTVMAMGVTLVELPCTSGLPVLWTNLIVANQTTTLTFILLLALYMLIFLADELLVFGSVVLTLKASRFEEKQGRILKLIGGMVMLVLAVVMLVDPSIMNGIVSSLLVFVGAMMAALVVLVLHRYILPRYGIYIGTEIKQ